MKTSRISRFAVVSAVAVALLIPAAPAIAADPGVPVVPRVDGFASASGTFTLTSGSRFIVDAGTASTVTTGPTSTLQLSSTLSQTVTSLASQFRWHSGLSLPIVTGGTPDADDVLFRLRSSSTEGVEGYEVAASATGGVTVSAAASAGAFYGGQTLLQNLRVGSWSVPAGTITDVPDMGHRAVSVDVARNFWTVAELKDLIRRMGALKLNALQIHFNENEAFRLYTTNPTYSALAPSNSSFRYSRADIDTIVAFAKAYHVTIIPEIDTPYHSGAIGRLDTSRTFSPTCGSQYFDTLDITSASVRSWVQGLYEEFATWFPGSYFHIGNDEVPLSLNNCSYVAGSGKSIEQWQTEFVNQLNAALKIADKKTMMWANGPDILPDSDVTFVNFGSQSNAAYLRGQGYEVVDTAWSSGSYSRFFLIPGMLRDSRTVSESQIYGWTWPGGTNNLGQQFAIWMDFANAQENYSVVDLYHSRLAAFAERTWAVSSSTLTATQFLARWNAIGDAAGVATRPAATSDTSTPSLKYTFDTQTALSSNEFTSPPNAYASSGSRAVPAVIGAPNASALPQTATGRTGDAVRFTGTSHQSLTVGDERAPTQWTVGMWVRPTAATADTSLAAGWRSALKLSQYNTSGMVGATVYGSADYNFGYSAPLNSWTHLTFVSSGSQLQLYVNGALQATINASVPYPLSGGVGGQKSITGAIDDLTVFYGALNASQVAALAS